MRLGAVIRYGYSLCLPLIVGCGGEPDRTPSPTDAPAPAKPKPPATARTRPPGAKRPPTPVSPAPAY
jgi:hypothetical protein